MRSNEWSKVPIKELCTKLSSGGTPSRRNNSYYENGIYYWVKTQELRDCNIYETDEKITEDALKNSSAKLYPINTVSMAMYGATVGKLGILKVESTTNQACCNMVADSKKLDYRFLYYSLINNREELVGLASGAAQQNLNVGVISNFRIGIPSIEEQTAIADTLSCLDSKIEINNRICENLEEIAQTIFKSWFVDFEPFQDGEFEDSELGKIPKGWNLKTIYDFAEYINGTSFKKNEYADSGFPIVKIAELKNGITSATQYFSGTKDEKYFIQNGDILFSWSGNPETSIDTFIWADGDAILNQHTFKVSIKNNDYSFVYLLLKYFKPEFTRIATSKQTTGLGHVTIGDLKRLKFPFNNKIVTEFCNIANPIIQMYMKNLLENKKLVAIRDSVLPKLLSGEIQVPVEEVQ